MAENIRSIRVTQTKKIEVNDNGEYIEVPIDDSMFYDKLLGISDLIYKIAEEAKKFNEKDMKKQIEFSMEKSKEVMISIDGLFGDDACRKIFGNIIPLPYLITDFFDQLMPLVEEFMSDRQKVIADKYKKRKGASQKYRSKEQLIQDAMGNQNV